MGWLLWSAIGTGAWLLLKPRTASATTLPDGSTFNPTTGITTHPDGSRTFDADAPNSPSAAVPFQGNGSPSAGPVDISDPSVVAVNQGGKPAAPLPAPGPKPTTVQTKTVITGGRKYLVTRAGLGIYKVQLASDPSVFQLITQTGPLQEKGDPTKLAQLKVDEAQFPGNLFA